MKLRTKYTQRYPTAPGLVLDIPFFEGSGSKALDVSGNDNHGSIIGAGWKGDGKGVCLDFDGVSNYVDFGNSAIFNLLDGLSVIMSIAISAVPSAEQYMYHGEGKYGIHFRVDGRLYFFFYPGAPHANQKTGSINALSVDQSFNVAGTWKTGDKVRLYIDGADENDTDTIFTAINNSIVLYSAGRRGHLDMQYFDGIIDNIRVYKSALSSDTIRRRSEQPDKDYCRGS